MNAKTHAGILKAEIIVVVVGGILLVVLGFTIETESTGLMIFFFSYIVLLFLGQTVLLWVPVRCHMTGCTGRMEKNWIKESESQSRLRYICPACGEIFDTDIVLHQGVPW